ncbi:2-oxoglutarate-dependent dioxygenase htyE [Chionoecetes opilio]|uniref:2-oxoglutarate-dependent dioxygenase htyE n=1 Tax=Chionoecetes opilio TaxID=41210 RepID=A0A8J4YVE0_CHIOP|nr:2-oxoglutarate-dependent dioxygenase htyE [Chionoecetes opilio]
MAVPSSLDGNIPVVNMGSLGVGKEEEGASEAEWHRVAQGLYDALSGVGFVYLSHHGIPEAQINNYTNATAAFFSLDQQTKDKYSLSECNNDDNQNGYIVADRERLDKTGRFSELRESYYMRNLEGVLPDSEVPQIRPSLKAFVASCRILTNRVLRALALGLGLQEDFFTSTHRGMCLESPRNGTVLRINHYPPLPVPIPDNVTRCGAHTDYGSITLLFQDSMGGLQVRNVDGMWVDAEPKAGTVLVNAGDLLQMWTANRIVATEHRVVIPKEESRQRASRYSVAFFVSPDDEVLVRPIDGSTSHPPVTARQHLLDMYAKTYQY